MIISNFLNFLLLFFTLFSTQKMIVVSNEQFSFTELSFFTRILNSITIEELKTNENDIINIVINKEYKILEEFNLENDEFLLKSIPKIIQLINQYKINIENYLNRLENEYISKEINKKGWKAGFVSSRILDRSVIMTLEQYEEFEANENITSNFSTLAYLSYDELNDYFNKYKNPTQQERNLFIFYNLLTQSKILFKEYLKNPTFNKHLGIHSEKIFIYKFGNVLENIQNELFNLLGKLKIFTILNKNNSPNVFVQHPNDLEEYLVKFSSFSFNKEEIPIDRYFRIITINESETLMKTNNAEGSGHKKNPRGGGSKGKGKGKVQRIN